MSTNLIRPKAKILGRRTSLETRRFRGENLRNKKLALEPLEYRRLLSFGQALHLDGGDDYAAAADNVSLDLGIGAAEDFTLEARFNVPDLNGEGRQAIIHKEGAYSLYTDFHASQPDQISFQVWYGGMAYVVSAAASDLAVGWHHVAAVFDNQWDSTQDQLAVYLDGNRVAVANATDITPGIDDSPATLNLGARGGSDAFHGWIDEVRLSDSVRYSGASYLIPGTPFTLDANIRALWHFEEAAGATSFADASPNGNTLASLNGVQTDTPPRNTISPVAIHDQYSMRSGNTLVVNSTEGILLNDVSEAGAVLQAILIAPPQHGALTLDWNGAFTYIPTPGFYGTDQFSYSDFDGRLDSEFPATVNIRVEPPTLVKDINQLSQGSFPSQYLVIGATTFFTSDDGTYGKELWKTDGTTLGTVMVKDIRPGSDASIPAGFVNVNGTLFFTADDGIHGAELWKSDGTMAGTVLVKDIYSGSNSSSPSSLTNVNGTLFFTATNGTNGVELWKSDGTATGTVMVKDIFTVTNMSSWPLGLTNVNGTLFFTADNGSVGTELWKSDGTAAGTVLVKDIYSGSVTSNPDWLTNVNGTLYFAAMGNTSQGTELWKSDGTAAGTVLVKDIYANSVSSYPNMLTDVNGKLFFVATTSANGAELWKSDGTATGTVLVKDIYTGYASSDPDWLTNVNGSLFFVASSSSNGTELWKSDGTAAGTVLVKDIYQGDISSYPISLVNLNGTLFFSADDDLLGNELWKSDGTTAGTVLLKRISTQGMSAGPYNLTNFNGTLLFTANDDINGYELWKSDGTTAGTAMLKNIDSVDQSSFPTNLTHVNGKLFFKADDGIHGEELWKSDGTDTGTVLVKDITPGALGGSPDYLTNVNGTLFFMASDGVHGLELWKSDGTDAGTVMVKDIFPGIDSSAPRSLTNVNGTLYFSAIGSISQGAELWKSDGTDAGTMLVKDIFTGSYSSGPDYLTVVDGTLFFAAIGSSTQGVELWKSDGTADGTVLVKDIYSGTNKSSTPESLTNVNGTLFFAATDSNGTELWKSDGTAAGTVLVKNIYPGTGKSSYPDSLLSFNGKLCFAANDGLSGTELWTSDGTAAGTVLFKDIYPGSSSSDVNSLANINGTLFFAANDGVSGSELWKSDGTTAGTVLYADLCPGNIGSSPTLFTDLGDTMYFTADDLTADRELWLTPLDQPGVLYITTEDWTPAGLTLTLGGDGKLHVYQSGTTIDALPPRNPTNVTGLSIAGNSASDILTDDYTGGLASIYLNRATLKIDLDNAVSSATKVNIDGGVLDLSGKTVSIGDLTMSGGSIFTGTLHAASYNIQSGTITAVLAGPGDLVKTDIGSLTVGIVNIPNVEITTGELHADSIVCDSLVIGPVDKTAPSGYTITANDTFVNATEAVNSGFAFTGAEVGTTYSYTISSSGGPGVLNGVGLITSATQQITAIVLSSLLDGLLTYSVTLTDAAGNVGAAATTTTILDKIPPAGFIVAANDNILNATEAGNAGFTFTGAEVGATYTYVITSDGGGSIIFGSGNITSAAQQISGIDVSSLSDGVLTFSVKLTDLVGNTSSTITTTAILDRIAPANFTITPNDSLLDATIAMNTGFTFAGAEVGAIYSNIISSDGGAGVITGSGTITSANYQISGIDVTFLADGLLTFSATLTDPAGNVSSTATATAVLNKSVSSSFSSWAIGYRSNISDAPIFSDVPAVSQTTVTCENALATREPELMKSQKDEPIITQSLLPEPLVAAPFPSISLAMGTGHSKADFSTDRPKDSIHEELVDYLERMKKQSFSALAATQSLRSLALQSLLSEYQQDFTIHPEGSELLVTKYFRKQNKLENKAVDEFHAGLMRGID